MIIIKIGGGKEINLRGIAGDLASLEEPFLIVHGAHAMRDELGEALGMPKKVLTSVAGYTSVLSDEKAINLIMMAYAGLRNKRIVEWCQRCGMNAIGLTGIDGRVVQGRRNRGIRVQEGEKVRIVRDFSAKAKQVNGVLLHLLLERGYVPVLTIPILDEQGFAMNSENDDVLAVLQETLQARAIIQLIEAPGFLENKDDEKTVVGKITKEELAQREAQAVGRMKRKLHALGKLFAAGKTKVIIADGRTEHPVQDALADKGTVIA